MKNLHDPIGQPILSSRNRASSVQFAALASDSTAYELTIIHHGAIVGAIVDDD
jgi:hypothetical protein